MNAYVYQAALYCEPCTDTIMCAFKPSERIARFESDDSDQWPQGPYADGGGESDSPEHCDACRIR